MALEKKRVKELMELVDTLQNSAREFEALIKQSMEEEGIIQADFRRMYGGTRANVSRAIKGSSLAFDEPTQRKIIKYLEKGVDEEEILRLRIEEQTALTKKSYQEGKENKAGK